MATIRQKGPEQWHAQIRRTGWPPVSKTLRTLKDAEMWARGVDGGAVHSIRSGHSASSFDHHFSAEQFRVGADDR